METVQRLDVGRWHVHSLTGEYVAAYNIVSAGGFELFLPQSSLAPLMDERDRAAGAMRQCLTQTYWPTTQAKEWVVRDASLLSV